MLQSLPKVGAPEDFDMRLRGRIHQEAVVEKRQSMWEKPFGSRVPAYALTLVAILATGVVAYYALVRTGVTPVNDLPGVTGSKPSVKAGQQDTSTLPSGSGTSGPQPSGIEQSKVSLSEGSKSQEAISRSRQAAQDELLKRGYLQQVRGGETQSSRPLERRVPLQRDISGKSLDSIARADSAKRDSLKRLGRQK